MNPKDKHADWLLKPTANELADIQAFKTEELTMWERNTTATMLRQQQADLKDADKYALELERLYEGAKAEIESLKDKLMLAKQSLEIMEGWTKK